MGILLQDLRYAVRTLRRTPGFTTAAVVTIALGVGATTALFSALNALLLRPLPVQDPATLRSIAEERSGMSSSGPEGMRMPFARFREYRAAGREVFTGVAAHRMVQLSLRMDGPAVSVSAIVTSGEYFDVLGVPPLLGRLYGSDDEPAVVLSEAFWREKLGGDAEVVGRGIHVEGRPATIAGVLRAGFGGTTGVLRGEVWVPFLFAHPESGAPIDEPWVGTLARVRPGVDPLRAEAFAATVARRIPPESPQTVVRGARLEPVTGLPRQQRLMVAGFLGMLMTSGLIFLLIGSANIGGMLLSRAAVRGREVAIRLAIGASTARLVRQFLTETLLVFVLGGALGIVVAYRASRIVSGIRVPLAESVALDVTPDGRVLAFALLLALVTGLIFGLLPAWRGARADPVGALRDGGGASRAGGGARRFFVAGQVALSVLLLICGGLLARTMARAIAVDPGFESGDVFVARIDLEGNPSYDETRGRAFYRALRERSLELPGVESASLAALPLLVGESRGANFRAAPEGEPANSRFNVVDSHYFATLGIRLRAGRGIGAPDPPDGRPTAVVNETLARRLWPGENPLGKELVSPSGTYEVVGVSSDGAYASYRDSGEPFAFLSSAGEYVPGQSLHLKMRRGAPPPAEALRLAVAEIAPDVAIESMMTLDEGIRFTLFPQRVAGVLVGLFALLGLLLAALGVYGVVSSEVARRTREFGIRQALGATPESIRLHVVRQGATVAALGAGFGLLLGAGAALLIRSFIFGIRPLDPVTFVLVPLLLAAVAVAASYLPAVQASRREILWALRQE